MFLREIPCMSDENVSFVRLSCFSLCLQGHVEA